MTLQVQHLQSSSILRSETSPQGPLLQQEKNFDNYAFTIITPRSFRSIHQPLMSSQMAPEYTTDAAFSCGICADDQAKGSPHVLISGDAVCKDCYTSEIKPKFLSVIQDLDNYPVLWGSSTLSPHELPDFGEAFYTAWNKRVIEYNTPKNERLYCRHLYAKANGSIRWVIREAYEEAKRKSEDAGQCLAFLAPSPNPTEQAPQLTCDNCHGISCATCGIALLTPSAEHDCRPETAAHTSQATEEETSMVRGTDYQLCPNPSCQKTWAHGDGCNCIVCAACMTSFCFLCGVAAKHGSGHWNRPTEEGAGPGCPMWNQRGSARAMFAAGPAPPEVEVPALWIDDPALAGQHRELQLGELLEIHARGRFAVGDVEDDTEVRRQLRELVRGVLDAEIGRVRQVIRDDAPLGPELPDLLWVRVLDGLFMHLQDIYLFRHFGHAVPILKDEARVWEEEEKDIVEWQFARMRFKIDRLLIALRRRAPQLLETVVPGLEGVAAAFRARLDVDLQLRDERARVEAERRRDERRDEIREGRRERPRAMNLVRRQ